MAVSRGRARLRRPGTPGPRGGGLYVSELQRSRLLDATFAVVAERGYKQMTVRQVSGRAGASNKTFYGLFSDGEDCFLAAFDHAVEEIAAIVRPAYEAESKWAGRIRAGLGALLSFLDGEPALCRLALVEALGAGPRVLERRAQVLKKLETAIDEGRAGVKAGGELPPLTAEGIVGAAFSVIHARLLQEQPGSLLELLNALMATIVLPYRGNAAAARELSHRMSASADQAPRGNASGSSNGNPAGPAPDAARTSDRGRHDVPSADDFRLTVRTQMVLAAVAKLSGPGAAPNNRQVSELAQVADQGQISKLLARLEGLGLVQNTGGQSQGIPNAWQLTARGEEIARAGRAGEHHPLTEVSRADGMSFDTRAIARQDIVNKGEASPC
jgi:AcrR family transcriptional regulator